MSVLFQIIDYLRSRGLLSQEELVELASRGILRWEEVYQQEETVEPEPPRSEAYADEEEEIEPEGRTRARGGRGGPGGRAPGIEPPELCERLGECFEQHEEVLDGLTPLGKALGASGWEEAAVGVRNTNAEELVRLLGEGLRSQPAALPGLWEALAWSGYHDVLSGPDAMGTTGVAYRALLSAPDPAGLGRYSTLLRLPEVAAVSNLKQAQRRLLRACGQLLHEDAGLVSAVLRRDSSATAYWPFVLLYAGRRGVPGKRPWPSGDEYSPPRQPPADDTWPSLWSQAVAMDSAAVTPFLIERTRMQSERPRILASALGELISSLEDQPREILFLYHQRGRTVAQISVIFSKPDRGSMAPEVQRILQAFSQDLRQALSCHPATRVFLQPAAARLWEGFLQACLRVTWGDQNYLFNPDRESGYAELLQIYYGSTFDLLCPRSWN
jgi:hypothetical protein